MASINIGELASTTLRNNSSVIYDNITNGNALLNRLNSKGQIKSDDSGGSSHNEQLMYAENGMYKWYSGLESFNIVEEDVIDSASFERKYLGTFVYFSGKDKIENRGKHAIHNLLQSRVKVAVQTLKNQVATSLYSDGTSSKQIGGLQLLVADAPSSAGTVGGIDQQANTFWRNQVQAATTVDKSTIQGQLNTKWLDTVRGSDKPDLILADANWYGIYESSLQANIRYTTSKMADAGFESLKYKSADFVYDDQCPTDHCYMLNTDYMFLKCPSERKFKVGENRTVTNADYDVVPIFFAGALTTSNRSLQAVLIKS